MMLLAAVLSMPAEETEKGTSALCNVLMCILFLLLLSLHFIIISLFNFLSSTTMTFPSHQEFLSSSCAKSQDLLPAPFVLSICNS